MVSIDACAYDFDAIVKDKFSSPDYTTPKSADCMLIQGNKICFIEFKRFPSTQKNLGISLTDRETLFPKICAEDMDTINSFAIAKNKQIRNLTTKEIYNSLKLKIIDSQILALHNFVKLLQKSIPADLSAIFFIVIDNAAEDYMIHSLQQNEDTKIKTIKKHTRRYLKSFFPCGIYHSIKVWIPIEFKSNLHQLWDLFDTSEDKG